ncbi:MAG TPA: hypothetical protein VFD94_04175 [Jatrophihabitans sp.]|nr:hypothetical protein [Jatrophihabitans sp.]
MTEPTVACQACGRRPDPDGVGSTQAELLSWAMDRRGGRTSWTCPACAATHLRALEAKLEPEWW